VHLFPFRGIYLSGFLVGFILAVCACLAGIGGGVFNVKLTLNKLSKSLHFLFIKFRFKLD